MVAEKTMTLLSFRL